MSASEKICFACNEIITGAAVNTGDQFFHPDCFVCSRCKTAITGTFSKSSDGLPICKDCTPKHTCHKCSKNIQGKVVSAGEHKFHPECFVCGGCAKPLTEFFSMDGRLLCRLCAGAAKQSQTSGGGDAMVDKSCCRCHKLIVGEGITGAKQWEHFHKECFTCASCSAALDEFVLDGDRYICVDCGKRLVAASTSGSEAAKKCVACGQPTGGSDIHLVDGSSLHWACFKCTSCGKVESENDKDVMVLLRTRVEKVREGCYVCDACAQARAPRVPPTQVEIKKVIQLPLGYYFGKDFAHKGLTEMMKAIKLLDEGKCTFTSVTSSGVQGQPKLQQWEASGTYSEDMTGTTGTMTMTISEASGDSAPAKGEVLSFDVSRPDEHSMQVLKLGSFKLLYQLGVPDSEVRMMLQPAAQQQAPAPIPAAPAEEEASDGKAAAGTSATSGSAGVMDRTQVDTTGYSIVKCAEEEEKAPVKPLPASTPAGFLSLQDLRDPAVWKVSGVDPTRREDWLADDAFDAVFGMSKEDFQKLPKWKRDKAKKDHGLF